MVKAKYKKPKWAVKQIIRWDRNNLVEDICKHGVGHPNIIWLKEFDPDNSKMEGIHGCDGCCNE